MDIYKKDPFWIDDIKILFNASRISEFIPMRELSLNRKLNAIIRLSVYFSVVHYLVIKNSNIFYIPVVVSIMTYIFYINNGKKNQLTKVVEKLSNNINKKEDKIIKENMIFESNPYSMPDIPKFYDYKQKYKVNEEEEDKVLDTDCKLPSVNNPFGNVLISDIGDPKFKKACSSYDNNFIRREIKDDFEKNLFMDVNDVFSKKNSERQFYTMPVTDVCNDQTAFAKWCYLTPPSCKEGNGLQCSANLSNSNGLNTSNLLLGGPPGSSIN